MAPTVQDGGFREEDAASLLLGVAMEAADESSRPLVPTADKDAAARRIQGVYRKKLSSAAAVEPEPMPLLTRPVSDEGIVADGSRKLEAEAEVFTGQDMAGDAENQAAHRRRSEKLVEESRSLMAQAMAPTVQDGGF